MSQAQPFSDDEGNEFQYEQQDDKCEEQLDDETGDEGFKIEKKKRKRRERSETIEDEKEEVDLEKLQKTKESTIEFHREYGTEQNLDIRDDDYSLLEDFRGIPDGFEKNLSDDELRNILQVNVTWWKSKPLNDNRFFHALQLWGVCKNGEHPSKKHEEGTLDSSDLKFIYQKEMFKRIRIECEFRRRGILEPNKKQENENVLEDVSALGIIHCISKLQECISRSIHLLQADLYLARAQDPSVDAACSASQALSDPFHFVTLKHNKLNDLQSFVIFHLRKLHDRGYRRYGDGVYEQQISPPISLISGEIKKFPTHAFKRVCDITDFILENTSKEDTFSEWQKMMAPGCLENVKKYLMVCKDEEFRELKPDRYWHAFQNGIYSVNNAYFYEFGSEDHQNLIKIHNDIVCCKYHEQKFDIKIMSLKNWYKIPTPEVQSILNFQFQVDKDANGTIKTEEDKIKIISWMYVFLGRMLHDVNAKDKWQVCLFLIGRAGTGKSLLLKAMGWFFNEENVETIANNLQKGFGLENIYNNGRTLACRCMEVKHDFALDQAQLQSMISGEPVSIQRKNQAALSVIWKIPIMLAGNECAKWINNSDSITRRMILAFFERKVPNDRVDPNLDIKIQANIGNLLHKCSCAYKSAVEEYGGNDLWSKKLNPLTNEMDYILPKYFHMNKSRLQEMTHPLVGFLRNESSIIMTEKGGMPYKRFQLLANAYFQANGSSKFNWKEDKYKTVFEEFEIKKIKIDSKFLQKMGVQDTLFYLGEAYGIGGEWLNGVTERTQLNFNETNEQQGSSQEDILLEEDENLVF